VSAEREAELERENLQLREQLHDLKSELASAEARGELASDVMGQIRSITAGRAEWEVEALRVKQKWEAIVNAARHELRLAQKGLTSGCGCPVGQCLGLPANDRMMACWKQWALSAAMVQSCNNHMDALRTLAVHPARIAAHDRNKA
jgi:hypothetical protein